MPNSEKIELLISPEALKQFEQLKSVSDANTASFEKLIAKAVELNKAVGNATTFKEINKATAEMTDNERALTKQVDELAKANAKLQALYSDEAKKIAEVKAQQQARNQAIKEEIQLNQAAEGSLKQKQLQLKQLQREYDNLSEAERNAATGTEMLDSIQDLDKELKGLEGTTGRFQRNVGNYGSALKTLESYLADVRSQLSATKQAATGFNIAPRTSPGPSVRNNNAPLRAGDNTQQLVKYNQTVAQSTDRVEELQKQEQLLSRIVESQITGFASATAELKSNEKALQALAAAGLQSTEFYQVLLKDTAELKDKVGDLKEEIKALSSDTRSIDLVAGAITGMVSVFQVGASAAELLSNGNEDVQKSMQRLMALQNIAQGIQQLANDLTQKGTALNKLYSFVIGDVGKAQKITTAAVETNTVATEASAVATEGMAVATEGLSVAMKVLRGALAASGIGLLIVGVVYLIGKIQEWQQADLNLIKQQAELNGVLLESLRLNRELADLTKTDYGTEIQGLKNKVAANQAYGRSQGEILAGELKLAEARRDASTFKFFDTHGAQQLGDLETKLNEAARELENFNEKQAHTPIDMKGNQEQIDAQRALLQSTLDLTKEKYAEQKVVVEDYYNNNNELTAKQAQIERLSLDERRKYELFYANLSANLIIEKNQRVLQDEKLTMNQRIALLKSTSEQQKKIAEAENRNTQSDPGASTNDKIIAAQNAAHQIEKIEKDSLLAQQKIRDEYAKRKITADFEVLKIQLQNEVNANQAIADNEKKSFDQRSDALYAAYEKRRQIITANYEFELQQAIKSGAIPEERVAIEKKAMSEINQLTIDYGLQQQAIYKDNQDKVNEIMAKGLQSRIDSASSNAAKQKSELIKQLVDGNITIDQFNKQNEKAERDARIISIKSEIDDLSGKKAMLVMQKKEQSAEFIAIDKDLNEKQEQLRQEYFNKEIEAAQKLSDLKKQLATEAYETFTTLVNAQFDNESARIQQQMDELDKQKDHDIAVANATIANKQERDLAIAKIELKSQVQHEQLEKRQRQIDLDRARFEKASNIAQIITTTAVAIINQLKVTPLPGGAPLVAAIAAIGALQLARAIAAPLPKFAEGTDDAPGGLAWVGDAYKKELVVTPQGHIMQTPAVPTVMNVPKHSIVLPDARAALESGLAVNRYGRLVQQDNGSKKIEQKLDHIAKVIKNKPVLNMNADQSGLTAMWQYGANWVTYADDQTRF